VVEGVAALSVEAPGSVVGVAVGNDVNLQPFTYFN